jgi:ketosteroid isomerase-like protein
MKPRVSLKPLLLIALACFTALAAQGPAREPARSKAARTIAGIAEEWKNAYNRGDAAKVVSLYSDDGYYLSAHILAHGREAIEAYWRRGIVAGGHIDFIKPLETFASGELGYCVGIYQATNTGVTVDGRILLVFRKIKGKWLIVAHETVVRDQP